MRAPLPRRAKTRAGILGGVLVVAGFAACADAVHLDPPAATDGGSTSTGVTTGCHSNPDCAFPTAVCDTVSGKCVACLEVSDCAYMPGTVCSKGACGCPPATPALTYCTGQTPACVDTETSATDCGGCGKACSTVCSKGKCESGTGGSTSSSSSTAASSASSTAGAGGGVVGAGGGDGG